MSEILGLTVHSLEPPHLKMHSVIQGNKYDVTVSCSSQFNIFAARCYA